MRVSGHVKILYAKQSTMLKVRVAGLGFSIPRAGDTNAEIEERLHLAAGWIERRTGILSRPTAGEDVATSDLAIEAGGQALRAASVRPSDVGLLLLATSTPDHPLPPTAPLVAHRLLLKNAGAIDLAGACSGFIYALALAGSYAQAMQKAVLVIASNVLSRRVNRFDPATMALFGDGAGSAVLVPDSQAHLLSIHLGANGSGYDSIAVPAGGSREPITPEGVLAGRHFMVMRSGTSLFRSACQEMAEAGRQAMRGAEIRVQDIDKWIPHQANLRLIREVGKLLRISAERTIAVVDRYANSSAATIPIAMTDAVASGKIQRGDLLLLTAVGAGITNAGAILRW